MLIILEGGDGSGKTTLCGQLVKAGAVQKVVKYNDMCAMNRYVEYLQEPERYVVCDRSFITDLVYRLNDSRARDTMNLIDIAFVLRYTNLIVVHCETETSFEDGMRRGEDNITNKEDAETIKHLYRIVMKMIAKFADTTILDYDWHTDDVNKVIRFINAKSNYKNKLKEL